MAKKQKKSKKEEPQESKKVTEAREIVGLVSLHDELLKFKQRKISKGAHQVIIQGVFDIKAEDGSDDDYEGSVGGNLHIPIKFWPSAVHFLCELVSSRLLELGVKV